MSRAVKALSIGVAIVAAQATGFLSVVVAVALPGALLSAPAPALAWVAVPLLLVGGPIALGVGPLLVHNALQGTRWAPATSLRGTILLSFGGLALGYFAGALFMETRHVRGGQLGSALGAVLGSLAIVSIGNLRAGGSATIALGLVDK